MEWTDIYAAADCPAPVAWFVIAGSMVSLIAGFVGGFMRARKRNAVAARAEAAAGTSPKLVEGKDVVLSGIVRHLEDHDVAVKVSITQSGSESESSGSWSHSWTEIDREIVVAPFLLELASGELVRVSPPKNVDVADALDQKVWIDRNSRVLSAELVPGEHIYARGRLERSDIAVPSSAYRDVSWGWALGPTDGQMLLSSEPLGAGLRQRARFHRGAATTALLFFLVTQVTLGRFYMRVIGETTPETVASKRFYQTTDSDGDTQNHYKIVLSSGIQVAIDGGDYDLLEQGSVLPVRRSSADNWNLGASPTIGNWHAVFLLLLALISWGSYKISRRSSRPWFRRKVNDSGGGRLPDPP